MTILTLLDHAAVFVFALTGALVASRAQLDVVGFVFLATLTAVGGGTLRDLLLDRPVFWLEAPSYLGSAGIAALIVYFTAHLLESRLKTLFWLDAAALGSAVAAGVGVAIEAELRWPIVLVMGVATGTFGGLMRDVVANEVPLILRSGELYVTTALAGSLTALIALQFGLALPICLALAALTTFLLRAGSLAFGWNLPRYKPSPPRTF
ncbi:trimeric intracellular cation channel family protein [Palleronia caenipelagi]|uniref:Trimeric intracellular cation channel family protein n=1 Tax=Palleronia caenipelagi TaxID=2489174 RepID=A0A547Q9P1_9RHOB|nr:trimeric intracellular cation channel family protein [Palleronia caenipelagi]TRD23115.1 trimeric intracellular cation channel family protein [Palleronia caenipelagi]